MNDGEKKKRGFALTIAMGIPKKGKPMAKDGQDDGDGDEDSESGDQEMAESSAGEALADAIKSGDGKAIVSALRDCMEYC